MVKLIQKSGYIKSGGRAGGYMKYIATREGVEIIEGTGDPTPQQRKLIQNILNDFPDTKDLFEYADYTQAPNVGSASVFISAALDYNAHSAQSQDIYMKYIATRPRVEKHGEHGLFSAADRTDLDTAMWMLNKHEGNVWTLIYSLRREDAARLGYDSAESWRRLITAHQTEMADAMKISPENFRWYAAYHDEGHHPHIHMMVWSDDPKQGYLNRTGIETMRSKLTNAIFKDEMYSLYVQKDISYKDLKAAAQETMRELIAQMENKMCSSPVIEQKMQELVTALETAKGKKQYGYLNKETKKLVDSIVDELAKQPEVAQCYEVWNRLRDELEGYYKDKPREHLPLSQQKEFRVIKNMVIQEAEDIRLGVQTYEDEQMNDEPGPDLPVSEIAKPDTRPLRETLYEQEAEPNSQPLIVARLEQLWRRGHSSAAHLLGKLYRDGMEVPVNLSKAEQWFRISAETGNDLSEYALGKMLLEQNRVQEALGWLNRAAAHGNSYAMYRLGKLCLASDVVEKDTDNAIEYFTAAAERGNPYAQYALGKLYLQGREVPRDTETALRWLECSAAQGNVYAQYLLDRADECRDPSLLLSATKLLHHMSRIFQNNSVAPSNPQGVRIDSKRRRQLQEKRLALGHKIDDHEDYVPAQNWEQRM